jgi:hypothetical protein
MYPAVAPPSAAAWFAICTPDWVAKCSPWRCLGCSTLRLVVVSPPLSVYDATSTPKMLAALSCSPSPGTVMDPLHPVAEVIRC